MSRSSSRSLRLLVLGQASSLFGSAILQLALAMYVLEATGSAAVFAGMLAAALALYRRRSQQREVVL